MIDQAKSQSKTKNFIKEFRPEIKFILVFGIGLIACFLVVNQRDVSEYVIKPITVVETWLASKVLTLGGVANRHDELKISGVGDNHFSMKVLNTCNGVYESIIFLMAFIAIQVPWRRKIGWMTFGFLFFHMVNEARLVSLFIVGSYYDSKTFVFFHETFWNYAVVIVALTTFIFCANQACKQPKAAVAKAHG